ncbi:MAG TPA: glycosyl hydrolase family 18 protein [Chloroflexota bacterium]|nr:glycosyl hydrolase family 18 protein [Chloroflexota bacterium]
MRKRLISCAAFAAVLPTVLAPAAHAWVPQDAAAQRTTTPIPSSDGFALLLGPVPQTTPVPAAAVPTPQPRMLRWVYMVGSQLPDSIRQHPEDIDVLSPAWFHLDANGNVYGSDSPEVTQFAKAHGIKIMPIVANGEFDPDAAHAVLSDGGIQTNALNGLTWLVNNFGYDGINIDFENLYNSDRDGFSAFMTNVYARVHRENGKIVTLALASKTKETYDGFAGPFDYAGLAPNLDLAVLMTYDDHYAGGEAGPVAPLDWVDQVVTYATKFIPPSKLLLGLPFYGYNWNVSTGGWASAVGYNDIVRTVFNHGPGIQMDQASGTPVYTYDGGNGVHQIWFENSTSLGYKLALAAKHGLAGWGAWRGGMEDQNFWSLNLSPTAL